MIEYFHERVWRQPDIELWRQNYLMNVMEYHPLSDFLPSNLGPFCSEFSYQHKFLDNVVGHPVLLKRFIRWFHETEVDWKLFQDEGWWIMAMISEHHQELLLVDLFEDLINIARSQNTLLDRILNLETKLFKLFLDWLVDHLDLLQDEEFGWMIIKKSLCSRSHGFWD